MMFTPIEVTAIVIVTWLIASVVGYLMGAADRKIRRTQDELDEELRTWRTRR